MRNLFLTIAAAAALIANAGVTETITIETNLVPGDPMQVTVITPEGYPVGTQFPTVYLLNGFGGNNATWTTVQPKLPQIADEYGMVMVMPDGRNSWYWDAPENPDMQMESFIIDELVPYIDDHYPTIQKGSMRAITGLSMGGQGGMWLGMRHPDVFGTAGSTSGGVDIRPFPNSWRMKEWLGEESTHQQNWEEHAIVNLVPSLKPGQLNIIFDCGTDDFFYEVNNNLHTALLAAGIPHDYISRPGDHSLPYWRNSILYQLLFFNEIFTKADDAVKVPDVN